MYWCTENVERSIQKISSSFKVVIKFSNIGSFLSFEVPRKREAVQRRKRQAILGPVVVEKVAQFIAVCSGGKSMGSVSKVEMVTPMALIYKVLFPSISTFETPPFFVNRKQVTRQTSLASVSNPQRGPCVVSYPDCVRRMQRPSALRQKRCRPLGGRRKHRYGLGPV